MAGGFASIGECMLELSDEQGDRWRMGFAGDALNTAWYVRALLADTPVDFISAFGDDPFSLRQKNFLDEAGIGVGSSPVVTGARPGLYAITLKDAERSFSYWRRDSAARSLAHDREALLQSLHGRHFVYFTGITLAILAPEHRQTLLAAIEAVRSEGTRIAFDPNHRASLWASVEDARFWYSQAFEHCDIVLPTWDDEITVFGDAKPQDTVNRLVNCGVKEIVIKRGAEPAMLYDGKRLHEIPAEKSVAIDTTGAGDSFCGGYLAGRLADLQPVQSVILGHAVASRIIGSHGALVPFATVQDLIPKSQIA